MQLQTHGCFIIAKAVEIAHLIDNGSWSCNPCIFDQCRQSILNAARILFLTCTMLLDCCQRQNNQALPIRPVQAGDKTLPFLFESAFQPAHEMFLVGPVFYIQ